MHNPGIDLAPGHKQGFLVTSPILLACGVIGIGDQVDSGLDIQRLGGVVVGPVRQRPHRGSPPPRLAETPGLMVLDVGLQNRGLKAVQKRYIRYWPRLKTPVIVHLADTDFHALANVAEELTLAEGVYAFELRCPPVLPNGEAPRRWLAQALRAILERTDLPVWVKLPLVLHGENSAAQLGQSAVDNGAVSLVVGEAPTGILPQHPTLQPAPLIRGSLYGPMVYPLMLATLHELAQQQLPAALIACGGIHTLVHAKQALAHGATALQIDSAAWIEPGLPRRLHEQLLSESTS